MEVNQISLVDLITHLPHKKLKAECLMFVKLDKNKVVLLSGMDMEDQTKALVLFKKTENIYSNVSNHKDI